jgi:hypothetical protein
MEFPSYPSNGEPAEAARRSTIEPRSSGLRNPFSTRPRRTESAAPVRIGAIAGCVSNGEQ